MRVNAAGLELIKQFEGLRLQAYTCPAGVWTIGYGHTGPDVHAGRTITAQQAEDLLKADLQHFERNVLLLLDGDPTTPNQFSAMVSLAYNIGMRAFKRSSVFRYHVSGDYTRARAAFLLWVKGGGRKLPGLVRRRLAESKLYAS